MAAIGKDILKASKLLKAGDIIGLPTETVYGLAGNAFREDVVVNIFKTKNRPAFDPLICHTDSLEKVEQYVESIPPQAKKLAKAFWPGPVTMLFPKKQIIPSLTTSGLDSVAFRIPAHPLTLELLKTLDFPLAAPSANPFGYVSPTSAQHVNQQLGKDIKYILDGGECRIGLESTIIGFNEKETIVYRLGGKQLEEIEEIVGPITVQINESSNPTAPGMLKSHYSPGKPVIVGNIAAMLPYHNLKSTGIISFKDHYANIPDGHQVTLAPGGDLNEAARNLFRALRSLDQQPIDLILTEVFPETGLGRAINDRLKRASVKE